MNYIEMILSQSVFGSDTGGGGTPSVVNMDTVIDGVTYVKTHNDYTDDEKAKLSDITGNYGVYTLPTLTKNGDGSITIGTDGVISFCKEADGRGDIVKLDCTTGNTLTLVDGTVNYIYCDYNGGSPVYASLLTPITFLSNATYSPVVRVTREGNVTHFEEYDEYGLMLSNKALFKDISLNQFERQSGLMLGVEDNMIASISSGIAWFGVQYWSVSELSSGTIGDMYEYYPVGGVWTKSAPLNAFDNTYYSNGTDRLSLGNNKYVCKYFFRDIGSDAEMYFIHGSQYNSVSEALGEIVPSSPSVMSSHSIYVGKIIIKEGETLGVAYPRDWGEGVHATAVSHDDLININPAGDGVLNGHITNLAQIIYGKKDYIDDIALTGLVETNVLDATSLKNSLENLDNVLTVTKESSGFVNNESVIVTYDDVARTITLTGTVEAYWRGRRISELTDGWVSDAHADINGAWFLSYDGSTFNWEQTPWTFDKVQIAYVSHSDTTSFGMKETHGLMQWESHRELHETMGTYRLSGGAISNFELDSEVATERRPFISQTTIADEDNITIEPLHNSQLYTKTYLTGSGVTNFIVETAEIVPLNGNQPYFNEFVGGEWVQTLMENKAYQALWLMAVPTSSDANSQKFRYLWIQGQSQSNSLETIQALTTANLNKGSFPTLSPEFVIIGKVIIRYRNGDWTIISVENLTGTRISQVSAPSVTYTDELLKVSINDTTSGYLNDKIVVSEGDNVSDILEVSIVNPDLDEDLQIQIDPNKIAIEKLSKSITQVAHGFDNDFVFHNGTEWVKAQADILDNTATHFAKSIDANTFIAHASGEIDVTGILDDLGEVLVAGEYYFLSQTVAGKLKRISPESGVVQSVLKVNLSNEATVVIGEPYFEDNAENTNYRIAIDGVFWLKGDGSNIGDIKAEVVGGLIQYVERTALGWVAATIEDINLSTHGSLNDRLTALENAREFAGGLDATDSLSQLDDATNGQYWIVNTSGTLSGIVMSINDMVICHTNVVGTPTNLDNFAHIPSTVNVMIGATSEVDGAVGLVPSPILGDQDKVLYGDGTWKAVESIVDTTDMIDGDMLQWDATNSKIIKDDTYLQYRFQQLDVISTSTTFGKQTINNLDKIGFPAGSRLTVSGDATSGISTYYEHEKDDNIYVFFQSEVVEADSTSDVVTNVDVKRKVKYVSSNPITIDMSVNINLYDSRKVTLMLKGVGNDEVYSCEIIIMRHSTGFSAILARRI